MYDMCMYIHAVCTISNFSCFFTCDFCTHVHVLLMCPVNEDHGEDGHPSHRALSCHRSRREDCEEE